MREQKGIKAMAQASGDPLAVRECNVRIKRYQDRNIRHNGHCTG